MLRFSVLVPLLGNIHDFEDTLASVLRYLPTGTEVIVVHDGTYDDPHFLAGEIRFVEVTGRRKLISMVNAGVQQAVGKHLVIARPGVQLNENWDQAIDDAFDASDAVGCVTPVIVASSKPSKIVSGGIEVDNRFGRRLVGSRSRNTPRAVSKLRPIGPSSWLGVYRRDLLEEIGPIDQRLDDVYLDVELALSLKQLGFRCRLAADWVGTVELDRNIVNESQLAHGASAHRAFTRHGNSSAGANLVSSMIWDLARSPIDMWLLGHAFQRVSAGRWSEVDRKFAMHIKQAKMLRRWEQTDEVPNQSFGLRRAA